MGLTLTSSIGTHWRGLAIMRIIVNPHHWAGTGPAHRSYWWLPLVKKTSKHRRSPFDEQRDRLLDASNGVRMTRHDPEMPLPIEAGILNLHGWHLNAQVDSPDRIEAHATYAVRHICPSCGVIDECHRFGTKEARYADLPVHAKPVTIVTERQRLRCKACSFTFWAALPHMDDQHRMTLRLLNHVRERSIVEPFTHVAARMGIDERTVRRIFAEHVAELEATRTIEPVRVLGLDELNLLHSFRGVVVDLGRRKPIEILIDKNKPTVANYLRMLDTSHIEIVAMDMWAGYRSAVREVIPAAEIVVDRYHITRMGNAAMECVRKQIRKELPKRRRIALKNDRRVLLKRRGELTDHERFLVQLWTQNYPRLGRAYQAKEAYMDIWEAATAGSALFLYNRWLNALPDEIRPEFNDIVKAMKNWNREIFTYFDLPPGQRVTNAYTETMNGLVKLANRTGRGYSFNVIRAKAVFGIGNQ